MPITINDSHFGHLLGLLLAKGQLPVLAKQFVSRNGGIKWSPPNELVKDRVNGGPRQRYKKRSSETLVQESCN